MVRLVRLVKLYKYYQESQERNKKVLLAAEKAEDDEDDLPAESHVGAAMSDLTNKRVVILVLSMLIVIPSLTVTDTDLAPIVATNMLHRMAYNNFVNSNGDFTTAFEIALNNAITKANCIGIQFGAESNTSYYYMKHLPDGTPLTDTLRPNVEQTYYQQNTGDWYTQTTFNVKDQSVNVSYYALCCTFSVINFSHYPPHTRRFYSQNIVQNIYI